MPDQSLLALLGGVVVSATAVLLLVWCMIRTGEHRNGRSAEQPSKNTNELPTAEEAKTLIDLDSEKVEGLRKELKRLTLEREIVASAMRSIYEAEAKGEVDSITKNEMLEKYNADLRRLEGEITKRKGITEQFDLREERERLAKQLSEIDEKLRHIDASKQFETSSETAIEDSKIAAREDGSSSTPSDQCGNRAKTRSAVEERIDAIRAEVLKAIERLERLEAEG